MTNFSVGDRVEVSSQCSLRNLVGREGRVTNVTPVDIYGGHPMVDVLLDNLTLAPLVAFYESELVNLSTKKVSV